MEFAQQKADYPYFFDQMTSAALHYYASFLVDIGDSIFVGEIFSSITRDNFPGLRQSNEMISIGLVIVSTAVTHSVTLWLFYARKSRNQEYSEYYLAASAQDHSGREKSV